MSLHHTTEENVTLVGYDIDASWHEEAPGKACQRAALTAGHRRSRWTDPLSGMVHGVGGGESEPEDESELEN